MQFPNQTAPQSAQQADPNSQDTLLEVLQDNLGAYVQIEFLIGTQGMTSRFGVLYAVGRNYVVLHDVGNQNYIVCDIYSIKFITFFSPDGESGYIFPYYQTNGQANRTASTDAGAEAQPASSQNARRAPRRM